MDYKNMSSKDLIHLISNQVLGQNITENNKLVIQDCCKELFEKKVECGFKRITYMKNKASIHEDEHLLCRSRKKERIVEVVNLSHRGYEENNTVDYEENNTVEFPKMISLQTLQRMDTEKYITFYDFKKSEITYTILEVEDIN